MNKKLIRNLIIAALAVGLLLGLYFWAEKWEPQQGETEEQQQTEKSEIVVMELNDDDIAAIDITNESGSYTVKRTDDSFSIVGFEGAKLSSASLSSPFSTLKKLTAQRIIKENADDIAAFGLDTPSATVKITMSDGTTSQLIIGDEAPTSDGRYAMVDSSGCVYLISTYTAGNYLKSVDDYRDTSIDSIDMTALQAFELYKGEERLTEIRLKTDEDNLPGSIGETLVMTYPYFEYVSGEKFVKLFENISAINAKKVVSDSVADAQKYGIGEYTYKITDGNGTHILKLGKTDENGDVYAVSEGIDCVFTLDPKLLDIARDFRPFEYIYKFVQIFNIDSVSKVVYNGKSSYEMTIDRTDSENPKYTVNGASIEEDKFKSAYQQVIGILFTSDAEGLSGGAAVGSVTFAFSDGTEDKAEYFEFDERNYIVRRSNGKQYLVLKKNFDNVTVNIENILNSESE